jgi:hypothetical protein
VPVVIIEIRGLDGKTLAEMGKRIGEIRCKVMPDELFRLMAAITRSRRSMTCVLNRRAGRSPINWALASAHFVPNGFSWQGRTALWLYYVVDGPRSWSEAVS